MKINNSKKELARVISENGGWREGAQFSAQDKDGEVFHYAAKPTIGAGCEVWSYKGCIGEGEFTAEKLPNWHQTILSRDEYFRLYPAPDAKPEFCESVMRSIPEPEAKPTIEQLAADYQAKLDIATRAQEEADAHRCGAEVALSRLEIALVGLGFKIEPISAKQEPELVITDWRDLQEGDVIRCVGDAWDDGFEGREAVVAGIESRDYKYEYRILARIGEESDWGADFNFIRRP